MKLSSREASQAPSSRQRGGVGYLITPARILPPWPPAYYGVNPSQERKRHLFSQRLCTSQPGRNKQEAWVTKLYPLLRHVACILQISALLRIYWLSESLSADM